MQLCLIRHGNAISRPPDLGDGGRTLTAAGRADVRTTGRVLKTEGVRPDAVWCSPLVRAVQTAEPEKTPLP